VSDAFNTIRKVALPIPLIEKVKAHAALNGERCFKPHVLVDLAMKRIKEFDAAAVYVSGAHDFLSTAWSSETDMAWGKSRRLPMKPCTWWTIPLPAGAALPSWGASP
jgi:hypothetical protein